MAKREAYNSLDLCKLLMAFCVVAIHTQPLFSCKIGFAIDLYTCFTKLAVPFFFLTSGFLLAKKMEWPLGGTKNESVIKKYLLKITVLYLIWSIVYLPLSIYYYVVYKFRISKSISDYIRGLLFVGEHYNSWPLWYLLSTIYALIFIFFLLKSKISFKVIVLIGCIIFLIGTGVNVFLRCDISSLSDNTFLISLRKGVDYLIPNGRILWGMFYIPVGMFLARDKMKPAVDCLIFCFCFLAAVFVSNWLFRDILICISAITLWRMIRTIPLSDSKIYPFIRKMSIVIYLIHMYVFTFYYTLMYGRKTFGLDSFIVTSLISAVVATIYVVIANKR